MKSIKRSRWVVLAAIAAALLLTLSPPAEVARGADHPAKGLPTTSELTAKWWRWVYSIPASENPLTDETGAFADTDQPFEKVFFLVGVANVSGTATRTITV